MPLYHSVSIGPLHLDGNLFLAPVAGWSDRAFRSICVDLGASFATTEMVSAEAIVRGNQKTAILMRRAPNERSLAVQLFGGNPQVMGEAAARITAQEAAHCTRNGSPIAVGMGTPSRLNGLPIAEQPAPQAIDINCGCPVPKVVKTGAGSTLMRDSQRLGDVVRAMVESVPPNIPVTVKIRKGWDDSSTPSMWQNCARAAIDNGAKAITMHPRTRAQGYEGKADWDTLAALVRFVGGAVPVFGSGDLFTAEDARAMIERTGVDGVMFARGAMGNPFIFQEARALLAGDTYTPPSDQERIAAGFRELDLLIEDAGEENAVRIMRKRFCAYTKGIKGGSSLRAALVTAATRKDYERILTLA